MPRTSLQALRTLYFFVIVLVLVSGMVWVWRQLPVPPPNHVSMQPSIAVSSTLPLPAVSSTSAIEATPMLPTSAAASLCGDADAICVDHVWENATLSNPFTVTGTARVFENVVSWSLTDDQMRELEHGTALASSTDPGQPPTFSVSPFLLQAPTSSQGVLTFFEASAKDGTMLHRLAIPIRFSTSTSVIRITVPHDADAWSRVSNELLASGQGKARRDALPWDTLQLVMPHTAHPMEARLRATLAWMRRHFAGPDQAYDLVYFERVGSNVYVTIRADVDGWAGVSFFESRVTPIIERNLLAFPGVEKIIHGQTADGLSPLVPVP